MFRSEAKTRDKTNLMVFLRPVIVRDQATSAQIANRAATIPLRQEQYNSDNDNRIEKDKDVPVMPPAPIGPSQGGVPAENLFNWNNMTRAGPSTTLPQRRRPRMARAAHDDQQQSTAAPGTQQQYQTAQPPAHSRAVPDASHRAPAAAYRAQP